MTNYCDGSLVKWLILTFSVCQVLSLPKNLKDENSVKEIFSESKRDVSTAIIPPIPIPLYKTPFINPYFMYPPGKPYIFPPFLTPSDVLLSRLAKSASSTPASLTKASSSDASDGSDATLMGAYFKAKKDEFLTKLFQRIANTTASSSVNTRSVPPADDDISDPTKSFMDPSFFIQKKYEFLNTLFKTLNATASPSVVNSTVDSDGNDSDNISTPKPTIVPPDFWFPFAKLPKPPKTPKPPKAPKPTKPPKTKKILKDALDTMILQSLLVDMGVDPKDATLNKRASLADPKIKKSKSKKLKTEEEEEPMEINIFSKIDPAVYSKASSCLNKLVKLLNKTEDKEMEKQYQESYIQPKATVIPANLYDQPSDAEVMGNLQTFLDFLIKSLNTTEVASEKSEKSKKPGKAGKFSKSKPEKKIMKRSAFLDELLHRATTPSPVTTTTPESINPIEEILQDPECDFLEILKNCCCDGKCSGGCDVSGKKTRSLIFKPFGSGYWIPQYLYATKMGLYLDKLMDTINTEAVNEVESESSNVLKRSVDSADAEDDVIGLPSREAAVNLIIAELTALKNNIIDAFADGIQAQKDATPTQKTFGPPKKSFKKPFWASKATPTTDPVAPIQKRVDILNEIFDKLTKVEKTLIFSPDSEYDPKVISDLADILQVNMTNPKPANIPFLAKFKPAQPTLNPESPEYFLAKTREYIKNLSAGIPDEVNIQK